MNATIVIQKHPNGETNLSLSTDPFADTDDMLVQHPDWKCASVQVGKVILIGEDCLLDAIANQEFRCVCNP
jgi:hypothetical protein